MWHFTLALQGSINRWNVGTAFRGSGGQREEMGGERERERQRERERERCLGIVLFCTFLSQNVKI